MRFDSRQVAPTMCFYSLTRSSCQARQWIPLDDEGFSCERFAESPATFGWSPVDVDDKTEKTVRKASVIVVVVIVSPKKVQQKNCRSLRKSAYTYHLLIFLVVGLLQTVLERLF